ncbi:MAG: hypothetical protein A3D92_13100 [Bacteroidetes bacterium RIFCSPHIGHO2_02_FULL_44_7]|nr:MAG: hypothetical protein A3D92_13100 [Bacteroidetes bacterium RIFCSPHIGHO2_02_FULL_44_7]
MKGRHGVYRKTLKNALNSYDAPEKTHDPRKVNLVVDALYFGERKETTSWCAVCFKDPKRKENLWWSFARAETTSIYLEGRKYLEKLGYEIMSVTGDGFGGLRQAFSDIPFQMCHVHMERIVINGTTRKPILEAGQALLALIRLLHQKISGESFKYYFQRYLEKYRDFLNEKTTNPETGETFLTHEPLHKATLSLVRFFPYLFTFETHKNISRTTNSLEGHFSHIRDVVGIHRGLKRPYMERVLHSIFLASTIAPTKRKLKHIL